MEGKYLSLCNQAGLAHARLRRRTAVALWVAEILETGEEVVCRTLRRPMAERLDTGDEVILGLLNIHERRYAILGVLEPHDASASPEQRDQAMPVKSLVLEATSELVLRVGEGSITIRKDGKILIKGTDLLSTAKGINRIKGGAVSIN